MVFYGKNKNISEFAQLYLLQNKNIDLINFGVKNMKQVKFILNLRKKKKISTKITKDLFRLIQNNYNVLNKEVY